MTRAERLALLGDDVVEHIHQCVAEAPDAPEHTLQALRRIFARPASQPQPVADVPRAA